MRRQKGLNITNIGASSTYRTYIHTYTKIILIHTVDEIVGVRNLFINGV